MNCKALGERNILVYEDGQMIFEQGSDSTEIYIIKDGEVEISQRIGDTSIPLCLLDRGAFFGEMAAITNTHRSAMATAVGEARLMSLSVEEMFDLMRADEMLMIAVMQKLIERLRNTTSSLKALTVILNRMISGEESQIS